MIARLVLVLAFLLANPMPAAALGSGQTIAELEHTAWTVGDGAPPDIWALAQTPDGYLWLATGAGLYRFDGFEFERVVPRNDVQYLSINMTALYVSRAGDLWIGYSGGGVSRLRDGELTNFGEESGLPGGIVPRIIEDESGAILVVTFLGIYRFDGDEWTRLDESWGYSHGPAVWAMVDDEGNIWVDALEAILCLPRGERSFTPVGKVFGRSILTPGPPGTLFFISDQTGLGRVSLAERRIAGSFPAEARETDLYPNFAITDRDGYVWFTDISRGGVFRISAEAAAEFDGTSEAFFDLVDRFELEDGLTSNIAVPILEDRDGNIWVGTNLGLNRFRPQAFVISKEIPATSRVGFQLAFAKSGDHIIDTDSLWRLDEDGVPRLVGAMPFASDSALTDSLGRVWVGSMRGLWRMEGTGPFEQVALPDGLRGTRIRMLEEDAGGRIWMSISLNGMFRLDGETWTRLSLPEELDGNWSRASILASDGAVWAGFRRNYVMRYLGEDYRLFSAADGLSVGDTGAIHELEGRLLVGGEFGLARLEGQRFVSLTQDQLPGAVGISGIAHTPDGLVWLTGIAGVVRVPDTELDRAFRDPAYIAEVDIFTTADGLPGVAQQAAPNSTIAIDSLERIWFTTNHGLAWHDPARSVPRTEPIPVTIRALTADGRRFAVEDTVRLPAGTDRLAFQFGALNLSSPERTRFRYRLLGEDEDWQEASETRSVQYSNLRPGDYAFEVIATDRAGDWPEAGAVVRFTMPPTFLQSAWFLLICIAGMIALAWLIYDFRLRQMSHRIRTQLRARMTERERIARELHDTLLQGFQGLVLRFQAAATRIDPDDPLRREFDDALDRAEAVLVEGRDRVSDLRGSDDGRGLPHALSEYAKEMQSLFPGMFDMTIRGNERRLHPVAYREIRAIACEALANAFQHSGSGLIEAILTYRRHEFQLNIRDTGIGIPEDVLHVGAGERHFGIQGMRERAQQLSGHLHIRSHAGEGTEVLLVLPGSVAFSTSKRSLFRVRGGPGSKLN